MLYATLKRRSSTAPLAFTRFSAACKPGGFLWNVRRGLKAAPFQNGLPTSFFRKQ
jgi:hypothetical protein